MVEAKDTVIKNEDIMDLEIPCETCDKTPAWGFPTSECIECMALKHREKQAEISLKAGMQKVVEWVNKIGIDGVDTGNNTPSKIISSSKWKTQLKAWGLQKE
jgi:hypothetical protein